MRYTLLEMTQRILDSMDSDEVNSIADTPESLAVSKIIKEAYGEIVAEIDFQDTENLFHLDSSGDNTKPCLMFLPAEVTNIKRLKYNIGTNLDDMTFRELCYLPPVQFLEQTDGWDNNVTWIGVQIIELDGQDFRFKYRNDVSPSYWTSPDDRTIIMDSYDSSYENTLTSSRTYGYGVKNSTFLLEDTFIPRLDERHFPLLMNAAKAQAFLEVKQTQNARAEKNERRHRALAYKTHSSTDNRPAIFQHPGYGRKCR